MVPTGAFTTGDTGFEAGLAADGNEAVFRIGFLLVLGAFALTVLGAAFVDFALVVCFVTSDNSASRSSAITFFGLPLFFAISEDIFLANLGLRNVWVEQKVQFWSLGFGDLETDLACHIHRGALSLFFVHTGCQSTRLDFSCLITVTVQCSVL